MVYKCSVPGCSTRGRGIKYFCAPFTNKTRWEVWLKLCPFLKKFHPTKREQIRFCTNHFLPEHIEPNQKLSRSAIPVLKLGPSDEQRNPQFKLEITPTTADTEPFIFRVAYTSEINQPAIEQNSSNTQIDLSELSSEDTSLQISMSTTRSTCFARQKNHLDSGEELSTLTQASHLGYEDHIGSLTDIIVLPEVPADTVVAEPKNFSWQKPNEVVPVLEEDTVVPEPKNFSWQKPNEIVPVLADDDKTEAAVDNLSMYCDDEDRASLLSEQLDGGNKVSKSGPVSLAPHEVFRCNVCDAAIAGFRYTCVQCSDLDLCGACEADRAHHHHYVLRVPADRHVTEVELVLATIRRHLMRKLDPIIQHDQDQDDAISLKSEVKSEEEDNDSNYKHDVDNDTNDDNNNGHNETNQPPEDDVLNRLKSPATQQHGDSDGEAHTVDSSDKVPQEECGEARGQQNTTKIYMKLADFVDLKEHELSWVQILDSNETPWVGMSDAQTQAEDEVVLLSETVAADPSRLQHASPQPQRKKRCLSSDLSPDTRVLSYNTYRVAPDYTVRLSKLPDANMNLTQRLSAQTRAPSGDSRDSSDEDNR